MNTESQIVSNPVKHAEQHLIGAYITVVYRIEDPTLWRGVNPLDYAHNGLKAVGVSVGDLMSYTDALEEMMPGSRVKAMQDARDEHCPIPKR